MLSIAIRKQINSSNINLNELIPFIGKNVLITITEDNYNNKRIESFSEFFNLVGKIFIDENSIIDLRNNSIL